MNRQRFGPILPVSKGLVMLIRSDMYGVDGTTARAADPAAIPAATPGVSMPTLLLGGLLLLISP